MNTRKCLSSAMLLVALVLGGLSLAGCTADSHAENKSCCPHGECTVCKVGGDLACIDIEIDDKTPHVDYNGKTYYFCSKDCLREFEKNPAKFAGK